METAADHGRRAGDDYAEAGSRHGVLVAKTLGPCPVGEVLRHARSEIAWARERGELRVEATALSVVALCEAMRGQFSEAHDLITRLESIEDQVGRDSAAAESWSDFVAEVFLLEGDIQGAEARLRWVCETLERSGSAGYMTPKLSRLGEAAYAIARYGDAELFAQRDRALTIPHREIESEIRWRKLLAKAQARRGEVTQALAQAAVELARQTDMVNLTADAFRDLGEVLSLLERQSEAAGALRDAALLYEQKGNKVMAARVRASLGRSAFGQ
jgi:tetratricopeptide (TPR) repeat protein